MQKQGSNSYPENYRPTSLTAVSSKIVESLIIDTMVTYILENGVFAYQLHRVVPILSCMAQLLCVMEERTKWLDSGKCIDTIFLHFQKAFESVPHERLQANSTAY